MFGIDDLISGAIGYAGQQSANDTNRDIARENNVFNAQEAAVTRQMEVDMSNTAHQRETADLVKSGINPMYSVMKGGAGASTPSMPSASSSGNPTVQSPIQAAINGMQSAMAHKQLQSDLQTANVDRALKTSQAVTEISKQKNLISSANFSEQQKGKIMAEMPAVMAETDARTNKAHLDLANDARERLLNQLKTGSGIAVDATNAGGKIMDGLGGLVKGLAGKGGGLPSIPKRMPSDFMKDFPTP